MTYKITIYTDGASRGNPGPGGFGYILIWGKHRKEGSKGFRLTTNNRMELLAVIEALEAIKKENCDITVYCDSKYVVDAIEKKWLQAWIQKGFKKTKNPDLWIRYLEAAKNHQVRFVWIKGHNHDPFNEKCDEMAVQASNQPDLEIDNGYEHADQENLF